LTPVFRKEAEEGLLSWIGESDIVLKTRFSNSLAPKAPLVAVVAGGVFLLGGVANADTPTGGSQDTGTGSALGGILAGGTGGLDLGRLVGPILHPILGEFSGGTRRGP
jgi:hypothetical protein